jgi:N-acetylmuramic acid 6-phosphate (MurNAc-6-P) etherase
MEATHCDTHEAEEKLIQSDYRPKVAILMILNRCDSIKAEQQLEKANGFIRKAI